MNNQHLEKIPVANPKTEFVFFEAEINKAISRVIKSGYYILGPEVEQFEKEFAEYIGAEYCVGVANGTDAISLALKAVGVEPGDEVITVSHSAVATVAAVELTGASPVLVDIENRSRCISPSLIEGKITEKTKAILPVHIYGHPADMASIKTIAEKYNLKIIEDCAQAHGAKINDKTVGTYGDAASFSFYPTKNLGALGDGGAIVTNSKETYDYLVAGRQYGWRTRQASSFAGMNSRLDELQAAILRIKLKELENFNSRRREIANKYNQVLVDKNLTTPVTKDGCTHSMHLYVIESDRRDELATYLGENNIGTARHYPAPIHLQPAYLNRLNGCEELKLTESFYNKNLSLPMFPLLNEQQVDRICNVLNNWE